MANPETDHQRPHAILFAYPLQGHVIPSVHLAIKLASRGFTITFVNTESIHHQTSKACSSDNLDIFSAVRESGLDIRYTTVSDGLPVEHDRSLNHDQFMESLLHVFSAHVEELVAKLVKQSVPPVTCLIADTSCGHRLLPRSLASHMFPSGQSLLWFSLYTITCIFLERMVILHVTEDTSTVCHRIISKAFDEARGADFVLCNTVQELEPDTIAALQTITPFYAIGPIFPLGFTKSSVITSLWSESDCTHWLDSKPRGSVLYISFGSYAHIAKRDLAEIANGLLLSQVDFVWGIRPDIVSSDDPDPLPVGFREAVGDRAMIIPWCSQIQVLPHPAIGGFLTHCGWNSILESVWSEVPLLCFPLLTDQFTNRKLVVDDWKIGINLCDPSRLITKEEVSENVSRVMDGKSGEEFKTTIRGIKKKLGDALTTNGSSEKNFKCFIKDLKAKVSGSNG